MSCLKRTHIYCSRSEIIDDDDDLSSSDTITRYKTNATIIKNEEIMQNSFVTLEPDQNDSNQNKARHYVIKEMSVEADSADSHVDEKSNPDEGPEISDEIIISALVADAMSTLRLILSSFEDAIKISTVTEYKFIKRLKIVKLAAE